MMLRRVLYYISHTG